MVTGTLAHIKLDLCGHADELRNDSPVNYSRSNNNKTSNTFQLEPVSKKKSFNHLLIGIYPMN